MKVMYMAHQYQHQNSMIENKCPTSVIFNITAKRVWNHAILNMEENYYKRELLHLCSHKCPNTHEWQGKCAQTGLELYKYI